VEEPPASTVFVLLADDVPPELVTVASRCVEVAFPPVPRSAVRAWLVGRGVDPARAELAAEGAGGDLRRARLLAEDAGVAERLALWQSVPARLDGQGAVAAELARALLEAAESATSRLRAEHAAELAAAEVEAESRGERGLPGRRELVERHNREERRWRTDELRAGLAVLARAYRDRLATELGAGPGPAGPVRPAEVRGYQAAVGLITETAAGLTRNANETLLVESLLVRLSDVDQ
jgi:DNA polymerase-3 subunit delta'